MPKLVEEVTPFIIQVTFSNLDLICHLSWMTPVVLELSLTYWASPQSLPTKLIFFTADVLLSNFIQTHDRNN